MTLVRGDQLPEQSLFLLTALSLPPTAAIGARNSDREAGEARAAGLLHEVAVAAGAEAGMELGGFAVGGVRLLRNRTSVVKAASRTRAQHRWTCWARPPRRVVE